MQPAPLIIEVPPRKPKMLLDDLPPLEVILGKDDPMREPTSSVRLPVASLLQISKVLRTALRNVTEDQRPTEESIESAYTLSVWIDILEGSWRMHQSYQEERAYPITDSM